MDPSIRCSSTPPSHFFPSKNVCVCWPMSNGILKPSYKLDTASSPFINRTGISKFNDGPNENFDIYLNMAFGLPNSSKVSCIWGSAWCFILQYLFEKFYSIPSAFSSYVDNVFGGPIRSGSLRKDKSNVKILFNTIIKFGNLTDKIMIREKHAGPARG